MSTHCPSTFLKLDRTRQTIDPGERISRYIFSDRHVNASGRVKVGAFVPRDTENEISVYRTTGCGEWRIWQLGFCFVAVERGRAVYGRGDLTVAQAIAKGFQVNPDTVPHVRHANITPLPQGKKARQERAVELANVAKGFINPVPREPRKKRSPAS